MWSKETRIRSGTARRKISSSLSRGDRCSSKALLNPASMNYLRGCLHIHQISDERLAVAVHALLSWSQAVVQVNLAEQQAMQACRRREISARISSQ